MTALMVHLPALIGPEWLWHPLGQCTAVSTNHVIAAHEVTRCKSYNFHSGLAANIGELALLSGFFGALWRTRKHLECHVEVPKNCHRLGTPVAGTGHRACWRHHPHTQEKGSGVTAEDILRHHEEGTAHEHPPT